MQHITVLQQEAVSALALTPASVVVDATLGAGGHAKIILTQLGSAGMYIGLDADATALAEARAMLVSPATVHLVHANFATIGEVLDELSVPKADAILADLGWRTDQFIMPGRGFSFGDTEGLAMTYGDPEHYSFTAADIVNDWAEVDIANVLYGYGEEHYSRRIAAAIVAARSESRITSAAQLAAIIASAVPANYRRGRINPATKSFQALRIAVNDELDTLSAFIAIAFDRLSSGGRLAIISFHSLEDRIIKQAFKAYTHDQKGVLVSKKPIVPSAGELADNPRARSAKLRVIQKS
jgi:16S rRNA (cytosine1402-N4)-methyltransferase